MKHFSSNDIKCVFLINAFGSLDVSEYIFSELSLQRNMLCYKLWYFLPDFEGRVGKAGFAQSSCKLLVAVCRRFAQHLAVQGPYLFETSRTETEHLE